jgi:hypothetical protein
MISISENFLIESVGFFVFVRTSHYVDSLKKELGIDNPAGNPTYTPSIITKEEILDNHRSVYVPCQGMKHTYVYLWYPLFQAQWDRCDHRNNQT